MAEGWYADASAFVKLYLDEPESPAMRRHSSELILSSAILDIEALRAARRIGERAISLALGALHRVHRVEATRGIRARATILTPIGLGSLDAIHLATALEHREMLDGIATYDTALADAARSHGLEVFAPR